MIKNDLIKLHRDVYNNSPALMVYCAQNIKIFGDFTALEGGNVLGFNTEHKVYVTLGVNNKSEVNIYTHNKKEINLEDLNKFILTHIKIKKNDAINNYIKLLFQSIKYDLPSNFSGLDIVVSNFKSEEDALPLLLALLKGLDIFYNLKYTDQHYILYTQQSLQKISSFPVSQADILISLHSEKDKITLINSLDYTCFNIEWVNETYSLFQVTSGISNEYDSSLLENIISNNRNLISEWNAKVKDAHKKNLKDLKTTELRSYSYLLSENLKKQGLFFLNEEQRSNKAYQSLEKDVMITFGDLMYKSHKDIQSLYNIICPEIDWIVNRTKETDMVIGAKMVGLNLGSSALILANNDVVDHMKPYFKQYKNIFQLRAEITKIIPHKGLEVEILN